MANLGDMVVRVGADTEQFLSGMAGVSRTLQAAEKSVQSHVAGWRALGSALTSVGATLSMSVTAPLAGLGLAAATSAGQLEMVQTAMTNLLGSQEQAKSLIADLQQLAAETPFQFEQLVQGSRLLLAYGFQAQQIVPILKTVGDAAAGVGAGSEGIDRIIRAIGQMQAKGAVAAQEMQQLAELGIPSWQILADAAGTSISEIQKAVESRLVPSAKAIPALLEGLSTKFGGMMDMQSQTLIGRWSTLKDQIQLALIDIGNALLPFLKQAVEFGIGIADKIKVAAEWFGKLPQPVQTAAIAMGVLVAAIGPVLVALGSMVGAITSIVSAWPLLTAAFSAAGPIIGAVASPIGLVVAALGALAIWVATHWEQVKAVLTQAWDGLAEYWAWRWQTIKDGLLGVWESIRSAASAVWGVIGPVIEKIWDGVVTAWQTVWSAVGPWLSAIWNGIKSAFSAIWGAIQSVAVSVWDAIVEGIRDFIEWAKKIPGVAKLMNLDEAWRSAGKLAEEQKKAASQTKSLAAEARDTAPAVGRLSLAQQNLGKASSQAEKESERLEQAIVKQRTEALKSDTTFQALVRSLKDVGDRYREAKDFIIAYKARMMEGKDTTWAMEEACRTFDETMKQVNATLDASKTIMGDIARVQVPEVVSAVPQMTKAADDVKRAWETLGLPAPGETERKKKDAVAAYEAIKNSGTASADEIKVAYEAMQKAVAGEDGVAGKIQSSIQQVSTAISESARSAIGILIGTEQGSIMDALGRLGAGIATALVEPWLSAFEDLIERGVKKLIAWLISETGLSGAISSVGKMIGGIFGGAASGVGGAAAGAAGGAAGGAAAGAAGSAIGGAATGAVGAMVGWGSALLSGGIAALGSIAGSMIGAAMMGGDLGKIEENTRFTQIGIIGDQGVIDLEWEIIERMWEQRDFLMDISSKLGWIWEKFDPYGTESLNKLQAIHDRAAEIASGASRPPISVTVQGNVIGNEDFLDYLAEQLGKRLALQGA